MSSIDEILGFWLGEPGEAAGIDARPGQSGSTAATAAAMRRWFGAAHDREILERFEGDVEAALSGERADWERTPRGSLALVLLLDVFPRAMYRGTVRELAGDERAQGVTRRAIDAGSDVDLRLFERAFLYMPLMHSESLGDHKKALKLFEELVKAAKQTAAEGADFLVFAYGYERKHYVIIERYGRFPHRNAMLGRASTPAEIELLTRPGSSF